MGRAGTPERYAMKKRLIAALIVLTAAAAIGATTFSGNLLVRQSWTYSKSGVPSATQSFADRLYDLTHTSGAGLNQMDSLFSERVTLTNGQARTVNLATGVTDAFGDTITFTEVKFFAVSLPVSVGAVTNLNNVTVGNAATNEFATWCGGTNQTVTVRPGGIFMMVAPDATGYACTNGNLKILNAGTNSVIYDLWIGGSN